MAYVPDLSPCTEVRAAGLRAVGWLDPAHRYPRAKTRRPALVAQLRSLLARAWQPAWWGEPQCPFCSHVTRGLLLLVPQDADDTVYAAPELIAHHVEAHGYLPPAEFLRALNRCPPAQSAEYRVAVSRPFLAIQSGPDGRTVFQGVDPVRVRPGMYVGDTGAGGLRVMLDEVLSNAIDQHLAGAATFADVRVAPDGTVTVEDDGAGLAPEQITRTFTQLHTGPTLDGHHPHVHLSGIGGLGVAVVCALSERLSLETTRGAATVRAGFVRGVVSDAPRTVPRLPRGTRVRYRADPTVFETAQLDLAALRVRLTELAALCPRLDLRFQGESLRQPEGLAGWVRAITPDAVVESLLAVRGTHDGIEVDVAFAWSATLKERRLRSFVNFAETPLAGSHASGLVEAIKAAAPDRSSAKRVADGLVAVLNVGLLDPRFGGPTRAALISDPARLAVKAVVAQALARAPWWWDSIERFRSSAAR